MRDRDYEDAEDLDVWKAVCLVCGSRWVYTIPVKDNPYPHGAFCPTCQDDKRMAPGVLNFKPAKQRQLV